MIRGMLRRLEIVSIVVAFGLATVMSLASAVRPIGGLF